MRGAFAALIAGAALCIAVPGHSQTLSLRVGGMHARYADSISGSAFALAPRAAWAAPGGRSSGSAELSVARFNGGTLALQGAVDAATSRLVGRNTALAFLLSSSASRLDGGTWSATGQGTALLGQSSGPVMLHAGVIGGAVRRVSGSSDPLLGALAAAGTRMGPVVVTARGQRVSAGPDRYTDLAVLASAARGSISLSAMGGARLLDGAGSDPVWQAQLVAGLVRGVEFEASAGAWPRSPDGFTRGLHVAAGLRLTSARRVPGARIERAGDGVVRLTVPVRGARDVAVAGEWNEWTPVPMRRSGTGLWSADLPLTSGAWRFAILVDGDRWTVPAGVPRLPDDFGGEVGVLVVR